MVNKDKVNEELLLTLQKIKEKLNIMKTANIQGTEPVLFDAQVYTEKAIWLLKTLNGKD